MKQKLYTSINEFKKSINEKINTINESHYVQIGDKVKAPFDWDDFMQEDTWSEYGDYVYGIVADIEESESKSRGYLYKIKFNNGETLVLDKNKFQIV